MKSIVVCVEFDDFLAVTLPRNARHFGRTLVVTSLRDDETVEVASRCGCEVHRTDAFYSRGAPFNKGAAMEEGFEVLGRDGWICVWDADIVMPDDITIPNADRSCLYTPARRLLEDPTTFRDGLDWRKLHCPTFPNEFAGYTQVFHASSVSPPWYSVDWPHAGGCDSDFELRFPEDKKRRPPFEVLHLGPEGIPELGTRMGRNWCGRTVQRIDGKTMPIKSNRYAMVRRFAKERDILGNAEQEKLR